MMRWALEWSMTTFLHCRCSGACAPEISSGGVRAPRRAVPGAPEPTARAGCMAQFTRPPPRGSEPRERGMGAGAKNFRRNLELATCDVFPPAGNAEGAADDTTCTGRQAPPLPSRDVPATIGTSPVPVCAVEVRPPQRRIACPARVVERWEGESEGAFPETRAAHVRSGSEVSGPLLCMSARRAGEPSPRAAMGCAWRAPRFLGHWKP